mgnify:CR=1 FL=1|jgi:hypothetical protein
MKKAATFLVISLFIFGTAIIAQEFTYVGAGKCKMCHKSEKRGKQYILWEQSNHSQSFSALTSDKAAQRAQEAGVTNPTESPQCLKCHAPLAEKAAELKEEGVTCEVCHGPGSAYRKLSIMKDKAEAIKNGLKIYDSPEAIKAHCLQCHENAHNKPFDFSTSWEKIKHPVPEK